MPYRYTLLSGGHADRFAKLVDRQTGKLVDLPRGGIDPGDTVEYEEDPHLAELDPKRFVKVDMDGKQESPELDKPETPPTPPAPKPEPKPQPEPEKKPEEQAPVVEETKEEVKEVPVDFSTMTVAQLQAYAAEHEIDLAGAKLKDDIISKLKAETGTVVEEPESDTTPPEKPGDITSDFTEKGK